MDKMMQTSVIGCIEIESGGSAGIARNANADEIFEHLTVGVAPSGDAVDDIVALVIVSLIERNRE